MGILDLTHRRTNGAIPEYAPDIVDPEEAAYKAYLGTPVKPYKVPGVEDLPDTIGSAYKGAGGGIKGVALGALSGLGKIGEIMNTSTGQKIMSGMTGNPYLGQAFVNQAGESQGREIGMAGIARGAEMERMRSIGDLIKEKNKMQGEKDIADSKNATDKEVAEIGLRRPGIAEQLLSGMQAMKSYEQAQGTNKADSEKNVADLRAGYRNLAASMMKAQDLNKRALGGSLAKLEQGVARLTGYGKGKVADTTEMKAIATSTILPQLKQIFGGNPTEGEREILLQLQGADETLLPEERERLFNTALDMAANRVKAASEAQQEQFGNKNGIVAKAPWQREWKK